MGNMCSQCNTCSEYVSDIVSPPVLENYQKHTLRAVDLDRYDLFYRIVGSPMIEITVEQMFDELNELLNKYRIKLEKEDKMGALDNIPLSMFFDFYKSRPNWYTHINQEESPFLKLL